MEFKVVNYLKQKGMCRAYPFSLHLRMVYISSQTRGQRIKNIPLRQTYQDNP